MKTLSEHNCALLTGQMLLTMFYWGFECSYSYYRPQRSCAKVMFSQPSVILFTGGGMRGRGACMVGCVTRGVRMAGGMHGGGHARGGGGGRGHAWQERRPVQ